MFQNFTGASRRPRQVNLSGRNSNPFFSSTGLGGPQTTVKSAAQDRQQRHKQREERDAAVTIQRIWRGRVSARKTGETWRQQWDMVDTARADALSRLKMLLLFFSPTNDGDVRRLVTFISQHPDGSNAPQDYLRLEKACLAALKSPGKQHTDHILQALAALATSIPQPTAAMSIDYYTTLASLPPHSHSSLANAVMAPLHTPHLSAYEGFTAGYLTSPLDLASLDRLSPQLNLDLLTKAVSNVSSQPSLDFRSRLWLLGQYIYLTKGTLTMSQNVPIVATLLSSLTEDIAPEAPALDMDNKTYDTTILAIKSARVQLNTFLRDNLSCLVDKTAIQSLINLPSSSSTSSSASALNDASGSTQLLASYALILLRIFPARADDIRMWLYLGPSKQIHADQTMSATTYFWKGVRATDIFSAISKSPRAAVDLLKAPISSVSSWQPPAQNDHSSRHASEWRVILIFLELFTFVLKIMDDEEFLGASSSAGTRISSNALPVDDVLDLTVFLKNLGFAMYFFSQEISNSFQSTSDNLSHANLSRHFGGADKQPIPEPLSTRPQPTSVAGTLGISLDYLKGLVTGLLRSVYERDSRRKFLPKGHWLMTSSFDMGSFISAVVEENERRDQLQRQAEEDGEILDDISDDDEEWQPERMSRRIEHNLRQQPNKKDYLKMVAPRLEILQNMPFLIPFETRVEIFRQFVHLDQLKRRNGFPDPDMWRHSLMMGGMGGIGGHPDIRERLRQHHASIRRKYEFEDAFDQFYKLGSGLKEPIQITFSDEFGLQEAGIDGGGVTKEFLTSVTSQAFDPSRGFFMENSQHLLYPCPTSVEERREALREAGVPKDSPEYMTQMTDLLRRYEFLGRVVGKCLYEGILIDISFAGFFLLKWALFGGPNSASKESGYRSSFNDLRELDEELYQGLLKLKYYKGNVEEWSTYFVINDTIQLPNGTTKTIERELVPNGSNRLVTNENRLLYISSVAKYRLSGQGSQQTTAFLRGLASIIQTSWLNMFNQSELQTLIGGAASSISVSDLRANTLYGGVYVIGDDGQEHESVKLFWQVMEEMPDEDRKKVLKFVTSTPRAPLLGFRSLNPSFSIRDSGADESRFPTTSTCVNLLKLPRYRTAATLRQKLLYAVNSGAGFDLS